MLTLCHNYFGVTSNNKNNKDDDQTFSKRRFAFGLFILFLVSVLWVVSSELTKVLYFPSYLINIIFEYIFKPFRFYSIYT